MPNFIAFCKLLLGDVKVEVFENLSHLFIYTLIFCYMKGAAVVDVWAKFHLRATCSSRVFKLEMIS